MGGKSHLCKAAQRPSMKRLLCWFISITCLPAVIAGGIGGGQNLQPFVDGRSADGTWYRYPALTTKKDPATPPMRECYQYLGHKQGINEGNQEADIYSKVNCTGEFNDVCIAVS